MASTAGSPKSPKSPKSTGKSPAKSPEDGSAHGLAEPIDETSAHVEAESDGDGFSDTASDYQSDVSATTSIGSSVFDYQYDNGRRYHAYRAGQYLLPNDESEQERLDITHHVFRLTLNGQLCASASKLDNPQRILDIGTGTGIWVGSSCDDKFHREGVKGLTRASFPTFRPSRWVTCILHPR